MNIVILADSFPPYISGVSTYCVELTRNLLKKGHKVLILTPKTDRATEKIEGLLGAKIVYLPSLPSMIPGLRICLPNLVKVLNETKDFKAKIIETQSPSFLGIDGLIVSKILRIPCISTFHTLLTSKEYLQIAFRVKARQLETASWIYNKWFYNASDIVLVATPKMLNMLVDHGVDRQKVKIAPRPFEFNKVKILNEKDIKAVKRKYSLKKLVAVYFGRVSSEKNLDFLIRAWSKITIEFKNSSLLILGSGNYKGKLVELVKQLHLELNVKFVGEIPHQRLISSGILSACDLFVSPSLTETFGYSGLEAMAHKLPSVLVETQGLCEIVGKSGLVCNPEDMEAFKENVLTIFKNPSLRKTMGQEARKIAKRFGSGSGVDEIIKIYQEALAGLTN